MKTLVLLVAFGAGILALVASLRGRETTGRARLASTSSKSREEEASKRFDLVDMLPAGAGPMRLVRAMAWKGRKGETIQPQEQQAIGQYLWAADRSMQAAVIATAATVTCSREVGSFGGSDCGRDGTPIRIQGERGCYYPEEGEDCILRVKGVATKALGASVHWPGCVLQFRCGSLDGHSDNDIVRVAQDVQAWIDQLRLGQIAPPELAFNRERLGQALSNQTEFERLRHR